MFEDTLQRLFEFLAEGLLPLGEAYQSLEVLERMFVEVDGRVEGLSAFSLFKLPFIELLLETLLAEQHVEFGVDFYDLLEVGAADELVFGMFEQLLQLLKGERLILTEHLREKLHEVWIPNWRTLVCLFAVELFRNGFHTSSSDELVAHQCNGPHRSVFLGDTRV